MGPTVPAVVWLNYKAVAQIQLRKFLVEEADECLPPLLRGGFVGKILAEQAAVMVFGVLSQPKQECDEVGVHSGRLSLNFALPYYQASFYQPP